MKFGTKRMVQWTNPPDDGATEVVDYQFEFRSCSVIDHGRYWACMRDFNAWFEGEYGKSNESARKSADEEERNQALRLQSAGNDYAAIMASLYAVRKHEGDELSPWADVSIPEEWQTFVSFAESASFSLILALADGAHSANPGLWKNQTSAEAKKNGGVSAG